MNKEEHKNYNIIGQGSYNITKSIEVTAGLRYDYEHKHQNILGKYQKDSDPASAFDFQPDTSTANVRYLLRILPVSLLFNTVFLLARKKIQSFSFVPNGNIQEKNFFDLANTIEQKPYSLFNSIIGINYNNWSLSYCGRDLSDDKYVLFAYDFGGVHLGEPLFLRNNALCEVVACFLNADK